MWEATKKIVKSCVPTFTFARQAVKGIFLSKPQQIPVSNNWNFLG